MCVLLWKLAVFWNYLYYIIYLCLISSNSANDFIMTHLLQNLISQFVVELYECSRCVAEALIMHKRCIEK
jgi:hypothetical protein